MPYTKDLIKLKSEDPRINSLIDILNVSNNLGDKDPGMSIMHYGQLCNCDDAFMCEHRLEYVMTYIINNFK